MALCCVDQSIRVRMNFLNDRILKANKYVRLFAGYNYFPFSLLLVVREF